MKILFVHNRYQYKGGEDTTLEMESDLLKSKGHNVSIIEFNNDQIVGTLSKITSGIRAFYNSQSAERLEKEVLHFKPDVIHLHNIFFTASPSVLYKAKQLRVPVVMTIQNYRLLCANALLLRDQHVCELCINKTFPLQGIRYKCYRSSYLESALVTGITGVHKVLLSWRNKVHTYIVPSSFLKDKLQHSSLNLPASKIVVKPNFISETSQEAAIRENFFLFVGRISPEKGITSLLNCFAKNPSLNLVLAGDGPDKEMVMAHAEKYPNITYLGQQPKEEILNLMKRCKALLFPSVWYEGLPLTIIEAFSVGTPVIASKIGAMPEMIKDEYNGFHFLPNDIEDLRKKVLLLTDNSNNYTHLYTNARMTYIENYHPDVHYKAIIDIYKNALTSDV